MQAPIRATETADFRPLSNVTFDSKVAKQVMTHTFTFEDPSTDSKIHYVILPEALATLPVPHNRNLTIEAATLQVVDLSNFEDDSVISSDRLAYILSRGDDRILVCDEKQAERLNEVRLFAIDLEGRKVLFSIRGKGKEQFGIKLGSRIENRISEEYKKALELYHKNHPKKGSSKISPSSVTKIPSVSTTTNRNTPQTSVITKTKANVN
jgi:hypothetical protein